MGSDDDLVLVVDGMCAELSAAVSELAAVDDDVRSGFEDRLVRYASVCDGLADVLATMPTDAAVADRVWLSEKVAEFRLQVAVLVTGFCAATTKRIVQTDRFRRFVENGGRPSGETAADVSDRLVRVRGRVVSFRDRAEAFGGMAWSVLENDLAGMVAFLDASIEAAADGAVPSYRFTSEELDFLDVWIEADVAQAENGMAKETLTLHSWDAAVGGLGGVPDFGFSDGPTFGSGGGGDRDC